MMITIMMNVIRKCRFSRSLFSNVSRADDHWEAIYPGLKICFSLQVYLKVEPSGTQLVEKAVKAMYGEGGAACANPT